MRLQKRLLNKEEITLIMYVFLYNKLQNSLNKHQNKRLIRSMLKNKYVKSSYIRVRPKRIKNVKTLEKNKSIEPFHKTKDNFFKYFKVF